MLNLQAIVDCRRMLTGTTAELVIVVIGEYIEPKPGQFIRVKCKGGFLPRPISVCWSNSTNKVICLVVESRGPSTEWLINLEPGEKLDISKPLGNGFNLSPGKRYLLIGGGIGVAPLFSVVIAHISSDSILCFKNKDNVVMDYDFVDYCRDAVVVTDDGSFGQKGRADEVLRDFLSKPHDEYEAILTCGPKPMMAAVAKIAEEFGISCQVSLEERMACGIGACKGCSIKLRSGMGAVCKDGPVFDSQEVIWDE